MQFLRQLRIFLLSLFFSCCAWCAGGNVAPGPYAYAGREADGSHLVYGRARYYDATTGRYTQRDPLGLAPGIHDYAYVDNNPVVVRDPSGLEPSESGPSLAAAIDLLPEVDKTDLIVRMLAAPPPAAWQRALLLAGLVVSVAQNPLLSLAGLLLSRVTRPRPQDPWGRELAAGEILPLSRLFRGDLRPPGEIFAEGFAPRSDNLLLTQIMLNDFMLRAPLISTSKSVDVAAHYALRLARQNGRAQGYLYSIDASQIERLINLTDYHLLREAGDPHFIAMNQEFLVSRVAPQAVIWSRSIDADSLRWGATLFNIRHWR